jgi:hypothetical protein
VAVQDVIWDKCGSKPKEDYKFFYGNGNANHDIEADLFVHQGVRSAVKRG